MGVLISELYGVLSSDSLQQGPRLSPGERWREAASSEALLRGARATHRACGATGGRAGRVSVVVVPSVYFGQCCHFLTDPSQMSSSVLQPGEVGASQLTGYLDPRGSAVGGRPGQLPPAPPFGEVKAGCKLADSGRRPAKPNILLPPPLGVATPRKQSHELSRAEGAPAAPALHSLPPAAPSGAGTRLQLQLRTGTATCLVVA